MKTRKMVGVKILLEYDENNPEAKQKMLEYLERMLTGRVANIASFEGTLVMRPLKEGETSFYGNAFLLP